MASRIQIGKTVKLGGKSLKIGRSGRKAKKYKACPKKGPCIHFGAKGYRAKPGTKAGTNYCGRSSGIKADTISANSLARVCCGIVAGRNRINANR